MMAQWGPRLLHVTAAGLFGLLLMNAVPFGLLAPATASEDLAKDITRSIFILRGQSPVVPDIVTGATDKPANETDSKDKAEAPSKEAASGQKEMTPVLPEVEDPQKILLGRLAARRDALDQRDKDLAERENVLAAAEKQIETKMAELKAMDETLKADFARKDADAASLKPLIVMYEAMKPKDAARIFEKMDIKAALPIANGMNPKKFSEVLAQIDPAIASKMTVALATLASAQGQMANGKPEITELPDLPNAKAR
jgi:flagellar motility protein MotE (MotC chaperone)